MTKTEKKLIFLAKQLCISKRECWNCELADWCDDKFGDVKLLHEIADEEILQKVEETE